MLPKEYSLQGAYTAATFPMLLLRRAGGAPAAAAAAGAAATGAAAALLSTAGIAGGYAAPGPGTLGRRAGKVLSELGRQKPTNKP